MENRENIEINGVSENLCVATVFRPITLFIALVFYWTTRQRNDGLVSIE